MKQKEVKEQILEECKNLEILLNGIYGVKRSIEKLAKELLKKEVLHEEELNKIVLPIKKRI